MLFGLLMFGFGIIFGLFFVALFAANERDEIV
jgi:hypothetical protein